MKRFLLLCQPRRSVPSFHLESKALKKITIGFKLKFLADSRECNAFYISDKPLTSCDLFYNNCYCNHSTIKAHKNQRKCNVWICIKSWKIPLQTICTILRAKKGGIPESPHAICKALDFRIHTQCACAKVTSQNKSASLLYKARIVVCWGSPPFCTRRKKWHVQKWCFEHDASKKGETHIRTQRAKNHWLRLWQMMQNDPQFTEMGFSRTTFR